MAFENLIIRKSRKLRLFKPLSESQESWLAIDGVISENTTRTMRLTNHPIENNDQVTDHVIREPLTYVMEGVFTDNPMGFTALSSIPDNISGIYGRSEES